MLVNELQKNISLLLKQCVLNLSVLRILKIRVAVVKCLGYFIKKVFFSHKSALKTLLMYISHFPEICVEISNIVLKIQPKLYR